VDRNQGPDRGIDPIAPQRSAGGVVGGGASDERAIPECLSGRSADEVLAKLDAGDPLGIESAARSLLVERAFLVDVERLVARGMAQAAYSARLYRGWPPLAAWLRQCLERALAGLLEEDRERMLDGGPLPREDELSYAFLRESHGVAPERAVAVAVVFNDLPDLVRRCYYDVFVLEKGIEGCAASGAGTKSEVERHLLRALTAMSTLRDPARPDGGPT
jgi:DNA-directed RNA polymerase specialized sigma24 family protein